jgi:hypothetical protein
MRDGTRCVFLVQVPPIEGAPNGRAFSGEPSERSERPERKRGRRVRCNAMLGRTCFRPRTNSPINSRSAKFVDSHGTPYEGYGRDASL